MNALYGMKVISSIHVGALEPKRKHAKKDDQSESYHRRVQKKWTKRFGQILVPGMYRMGDTIIAHPEIIKKLKAATQENAHA